MFSTLSFIMIMVILAAVFLTSSFVVWAYCWKWDIRNKKYKAYIIHKILLAFSGCAVVILAILVYSK
jgi:hypothetical protein